MSGGNSSSRISSGGSSSNPYTATHVDTLFKGMPTELRAQQLIEAFRKVSQQSRSSAETATRNGAIRSTLFLIGVERGRLYTSSVMDDVDSATSAGRAAWRRQRRLAWYLWQAAAASRVPAAPPAAPPAPPLLLLAELDDISDGGITTLPKLSSSASACGLKIPVPILLKGFGTTDLERYLDKPHGSSSSAARGQLAGQHGSSRSKGDMISLALGKRATPSTPWHTRREVGVWRGSSRSVLPQETCSAIPSMRRWQVRSVTAGNPNCEAATPMRSLHP